MSSKIKAIIISSIVLVFLVGGIVLLKVTDSTRKESSSSSSSSTTSKLLYEEKQADVELVHIKNESGEYDVALSGDSSWTVKGYEDLPLNSNAISGITSAAASMTAADVIEENASSLSQYGLDKPAAEVKVTFKDSAKTVKEFLVGNETPSGGKRYFAFKGENKVYSVSSSSVSTFLKSASDLINTTLVEAVSDNNYPYIGDVTIERADLGFPVKLSYDESLDSSASDSSSSSSSSSSTSATASEYDTVHVMTSPIKASLKTENSSKLVRGIFGLTAKSAYILRPADADLEKTGITNPSAVVTVKLEDKTYKLIIGSAYTDGSDKGYYGMLDGINIVFKFEESALPWITFKPIEIVNPLITSTLIYDLSKIEIRTPEKTTVFDLEGDKADNFKAKMDGKDIDTDYFKDFYQFILMAPAESLWLEDPASATPDVKIVFTKDNGEVYNLEFYKVENRQTIIKYNGVTSYKCRTTYVDRLLSNLELLPTKGKLVMVW